jgi:hypothetical protein
LKQIIYFLFLISVINITAQDTTLQVKSAITFPLRIKLKTLEDITNTHISGEIYKDTSHTDNENDQFKCRVWKNGSIKISHVQNNVLKIDVPLKIWAEKGIGTFGVYTYQSTDFQVIMSFQMVYTITNDWKLKTKTIKNGFTWVQKPSLEVAKIKIPLTSIIESKLNKQQEESALLIDENIAKSFDLKKDVLNVWNQLKTPQLISEQYNTWLKLSPIQIECSPFTQDALVIQSIVKVHILSETYMGATPISRDTNDIPKMKLTLIKPSEFELYTTVNIPSIEATEITKKKFIGQEYQFQNGSYNVKLTDISIGFESNNLIIETEMEGSYKGKMRIKGIPYYNDEKNIIKLKNVTIDLQTKNMLIKAYDWIFSGKIEQAFETNFEIPTKENMDYSKQMTQQALNQVRNGMKFTGYITEMKPKEICIFPNKMCLVILSKGGFQVEY